MNKRISRILFIIIFVLALLLFVMLYIEKSFNEVKMSIFHNPITFSNISFQFTGSQEIQYNNETILSGFVVYTSAVENNMQLFKKNLYTNEIVQLTSEGNNSDAKISPDGNHILYLLNSKENLDDIYLMDWNGSNVKVLIATEANEDGADWSPDGKKIAFASDESGEWQIYIMELESQDVFKITDSKSGASSPSWSSDGTRIAFASGDGGEATRTQIFIMDADGSNVRQMTDFDVYTWDGGPVWCPDDSCLVFERNSGGGAKLMVLDIASKSVTPLLQERFDSKTLQTALNHSFNSDYITFMVYPDFYVFDMRKMELIPFDIEGHAFSLSYFPQ